MYYIKIIECNEVEAILMKGLEEGTVKLHIVKCGVSGPPDTGKSHVRALLLGEDRPLHRVSTAMATEADVVTTDITRIPADEDVVELQLKKKGCLWKIVKDNSMARVIANTIYNEDYSCLPTGNSKPSETDGAPSSHHQSQRKNYKVLNDIKRLLRQKIGTMKRKRKGLNGIHLLYFVDTGGQPQFQEILPNFIKCDINLLVHNLSQSLKHCPGFNYVIDGKHFTVPERMKLPNIDIIEQSVRSIVSSNISPDSQALQPNVAILGTFKDQCPTRYDEFSAMLKAKSEFISKRLKPYIGHGREKCSLFSPSRSQDQRVFAIDGSLDGWDKNDEVLDKLKSSILTRAEKNSIDVPIRYFVFLLILKSHASRKNNPFVTLSNCKEIASDCSIPMDEQDIREALKLFNKCNIVLYFPYILENVAFIKPGFLFNKVTNLIVSSFQCEDDEMSDERAHFRKTGIFSTAIFQQASSLQLANENFTEHDFLKLLKGLYIIAELDHGSYFMPCVLPLENLSPELKEVKGCMKDNGIDGPFMISFRSKMSPRGLFCALLVALLRNREWKLSTLPVQDDIFRYRNLVEFDLIGSYRGKVIVIDRNCRLEVYTTCEKNGCLKIQEAVYHAFNEACRNLNYSNEDIDLGFPCSVCDRQVELHSTEITQGENLWKERCTIFRRKRPIPLTKERLVWLYNNTDISKFTLQRL